MKNYEYILFDLDGTITDSKVGITKAVAYSLKSFGIEVNDLDSLNCFIGPPLSESYMTYFGFDKDKTLKAVDKYREYYSTKGLFENKVYDGIEALFQNLLKGGKKIILATAKPIVYADQILEYYNLSKYFTATYGCELNGLRVHKGEVIKYAMDKSHIKPEQAIMIGDREHDVIGAKENGLDCIGVLYGYGSLDELKKAGANYIAETTRDIERLILA